ncbi:MAG: cob(I)yrinic acid a,c-diamide adenosyltransferase [Bacteroidetes bacterium]|nr:cob(I)yrinic acid a,c-diamide adenosyltransferase [Bacteroidota bacterium]
MKIYTKTGDKGETSLFGGKRVSKNSLRIDCYGTVDELNSFIGIICSNKPSKKISLLLNVIQNELFIIGADLATPNDAKTKSFQKISNKNIKNLENYIDNLELKLPKLKNFILPGGSVVGSSLHYARTVCRSAERKVVALSKLELIDKLLIVYLNRLSDLLFVMARYENKENKKSEINWVSK